MNDSQTLIPDTAAEAVAPAKLEDAPAAAHVLPFGCARRQTMYKALVQGPTPGPRESVLVLIPSCPGCGDEHQVLDKFGRDRRPGEDVDVMVAAPPPPLPDPTKLHGRQIVTDAAITAAITAEEAPAAEVAEAVGFTGTHAIESLKKRIRRMNAAAVERGKPEPFIYTSERGMPSTVRRAENGAATPVKSGP